MLTHRSSRRRVLTPSLALYVFTHTCLVHNAHTCMLLLSHTHTSLACTHTTRIRTHAHTHTHTHTHTHIESTASGRWPSTATQFFFPSNALRALKNTCTHTRTCVHAHGVHVFGTYVCIMVPHLLAPQGTVQCRKTSTLLTSKLYN